MLLDREIRNRVENSTPPTASVVLGPRQVGKSTLFKQITGNSARWFDGERPAHVRQLEKAYDSGDLETILQSSPILVIDEAQKIPNIGSIIKSLVDANQTTKIFITGSSALTLSLGVKESALGRLVTQNLWPFTLSELTAAKGKWNVDESIATRAIYGMYPTALTMEHPEDFLYEYVRDLLFKDIFALSGIRNSQSFMNLVYFLATHIGQEINYDSLAREVSLNRVTISKYIDLMEQCFIIKVCNSYSTNLENELKKGKKIYFTDCGIRNAILDDFSPLSSRPDAGALWENFFYMEKIKRNSYMRNHRHLYFWRTRQIGSIKPKEVDFVEIKNRKPIFAYECKISPNAHSSGAHDFLEKYPGAEFLMANPESLTEIISK